MSYNECPEEYEGNEDIVDMYIGDWIDKKCPECNSQLLGNKNGDEWCSNIECKFGCEEFYKDLGL